MMRKGKGKGRGTFGGSTKLRAKPVPKEATTVKVFDKDLNNIQDDTVLESKLTQYNNDHDII